VNLRAAILRRLRAVALLRAHFGRNFRAPCGVQKKIRPKLALRAGTERHVLPLSCAVERARWRLGTLALAGSHFGVCALKSGPGPGPGRQCVV